MCAPSWTAGCGACCTDARVGDDASRIGNERHRKWGDVWEGVASSRDSPFSVKDCFAGTDTRLFFFLSQSFIQPHLFLLLSYSYRPLSKRRQLFESIISSHFESQTNHRDRLKTEKKQAAHCKVKTCCRQSKNDIIRFRIVRQRRWVESKRNREKKKFFYLFQIMNFLATSFWRFFHGLGPRVPRILTLDPCRNMQLLPGCPIMTGLGAALAVVFSAALTLP